MAVRFMGLIFKLTFSFVFAFFGLQASQYYVASSWLKDGGPPVPYFTEVYTAAFVILGLLVGFSLAAILFRRLMDLGANLAEVPAPDKIAGTLGIFIGLGMTALLGALLYRIESAGPFLVLLASVPCIYLGVVVAISMKDELHELFRRPSMAPPEEPEDTGPARARTKLLDTNVIIDGRISDVCKTGFVEGLILIPTFVLEELHQIADSADNLRRARGRRGLDILNQMQSESALQVEVCDDAKFALSRADAVDVRLIRLAQALDADIVTNDFNLNKVASLHGVKVLNVNELANALKPVVLPGEDMSVTVVREGKELNQGVAYLDDGTMVVIENGKSYIGDTISVVVSSVLQTIAGKMIFAAPKDDVGANHVGSGRDDRTDSGSGDRRKARHWSR